MELIQEIEDAHVGSAHGLPDVVGSPSGMQLGPSQHLTLWVGPRKAKMEQGCRVKRPLQWTE